MCTGSLEFGSLRETSAETNEEEIRSAVIIVQ